LPNLFPQLPQVIMAAAWRLANMGEWTKKFTAEVRLTGDAQLKWQTFNAISMHVNRGVEAPAYARPARRRTLEELLRPPADPEALDPVPAASGPPSNRRASDPPQL